jgi:general secretion pathway protein H
MPISVPGSSFGWRSGSGRHARAARSCRERGFTLIELLVVIAIIAVSAGLITLSLRDGHAARLEEEGARLAALLEMARAEARVSGAAVRWVPKRADSNDPDPNIQFRFVGLSLQQALPTRWLDAGTSAQIVGAATVVLGPEAILPPQRIVLRLENQRLELASDGLGPFAVASSGTAP